MSGPKPTPALDVTWQHAIDAWAVQMYARAMTRATITTRISHMRQLSREIGVTLPSLKAQDLLSWTARKGWHNRVTQHNYHCAIRAFLASARPELVDVLPTVRVNFGTPRPISDALYWRAYDQADERCRLILMLARAVGMRRCEIAVTALQDLDLDRCGLTIHGKGGKDRFMPVTDNVIDHVEHWLLQVDSSSWLFPGQDAGHLSAMWVGTLAHNALRGAGTLHQLRHSCATAAWRETGDILAVQAILGHTSLRTTQIYVGMADNAVRQAIEAAAPKRPTQEQTLA